VKPPTNDELNEAAKRAATRLDWLLDAEQAGMRANPDWRQLATCDETGDWVTLPQHVGIKKMRAIKAYELSVCGSCPVTGPCLDYALDNNEWVGIFGGKVPAERRRIKAVTTVPRCGTQAGFSAHRRRREVPCPACRRAFNQAQAQRKRRRAVV
jgi:hypothetical protein